MENDSPPDPSKILGLVGIFAASLVAAYLPSASAKFALLRLPGRTFFYARHFGTGVILSTSFTHLLNTAFLNLQHVRWLGYKQWAGLLVMASLVAIFFVEYVSNAYLQYIEVRVETPDDVDSHPNGHKTIGQNGFANGTAGEATPLLETGSANEEGRRLSLVRTGRILGVLILQVGIMLHSFVIGLTMAVASAERFRGLVPAIFFHQVFEGIALGVRLANLRQPPQEDFGGADHSHLHDHNHHLPQSLASGPRSTQSSSFQPSRMERILPPLLSVFFAVPIPLMLLLSLWIPGLQANKLDLTGPETSGAMANLSQMAPLSLSGLSALIAGRSEILQGITSAVSAGLLIYVSCVELLAADFLHSQELQRSSASVQTGALVAFAAGAAGMSLI